MVYTLIATLYHVKICSWAENGETWHFNMVQPETKQFNVSSPYSYVTLYDHLMARWWYDVGVYLGWEIPTYNVLRLRVKVRWSEVGMRMKLWWGWNSREGENGLRVKHDKFKRKELKMVITVNEIEFITDPWMTMNRVVSQMVKIPQTAGPKPIEGLTTIVIGSAANSVYSLLVNHAHVKCYHLKIWNRL